MYLNLESFDDTKSFSYLTDVTLEYIHLYMIILMQWVKFSLVFRRFWSQMRYNLLSS